MTKEEAIEYAKNYMSFREAVYNALQGKCIPYRKATLIKLYELLDMVEPQEGANDVLDKIRAEIEEIAKPNEFGGRGYGKSVRYGLCKALEIIDKYKAESEVQEWQVNRETQDRGSQAKY